ncbi:MAG: 50S ribosomal protein L18 [uncultured bacterium]|nr:MAG: 50S ribosomal protein L18 [uncultured bacterium]HBC71308.1 50S ribosomal protein L18 [Coxiellaceae bacterium]HBS51676.1 50S ribosomal protein L18 [Coxiellaceae bacterium]HBY55368.1 50S ribosomal protein L18 [Coxiellaceae bacterium]
MNKKMTRMRRAKKTRSKIKELSIPCLSVHRTPRHIYAQLIMPSGKIGASISTLDSEVKKECVYGGNVKAASVIGKAIALQIKKAGITKISFDRSGFKYHGRIKALADAAREQGLEF